MPSETEDTLAPRPETFEPKIAALWARVLASLIDWALWIPPSAALFYLALRRPDLASACVAIWLLGKPLYELLMHGAFGATLGKMLVRIRLERADGRPMDMNAAIRRGFVPMALGLSIAMIAARLLQGASLEPLPAFTTATNPEAIRAAIEKLLSVLTSNDGYATLHQFSQLWWAMEWATCLTNPRRRALHDYIGGTVVVRKMKNQEL